MTQGKLVRISTAFCSAALGVFLLAASKSGTLAFKVEDITLSSIGNSALQLRATLHLPDTPKYPISSVVITPSSGGIQKHREVYYANELAQVGIAALLVDSFSSRGLTDSVHDQSILTSSQTSEDAVAALRWLIQDHRFKREKIGVMGVSKGGIVAMNMANVVRRRWLGANEVEFAAHVAISPGCSIINRSLVTTGAPILLLLAEFDDRNLALPCVEYAERLRQAGNPNIEVKVYKGAQHAWEKIGNAPEYDALAQNLSRCRIWIEDDGASVPAEMADRIPRGREFEWIKQHCMTLGAWCCGGTIELKQQATNDLITFLRQNGF